MQSPPPPSYPLLQNKNKKTQQKVIIGSSEEVWSDSESGSDSSDEIEEMDLVIDHEGTDEVSDGTEDRWNARKDDVAKKHESNFNDVFKKRRKSCKNLNWFQFFP